MSLPLQFRLDDLSGERTRALISRHLAGMRANSPPGSVHALEIDKLRGSDVTFWSVWLGEEIAGCGALKRLDARRVSSSRFVWPTPSWVVGWEGRCLSI